MDEKTKQITESIIITQICLFMNERIKGTGYYIQELKNRGNQFIKELVKA